MRVSIKISALLLVCVSVGFLATGCSEDVQETREMAFSLSRYSVAFTVAGGTATVTVGTSDSWNASTDASWLTLAADGATLYITAEANDRTAEIRKAEVVVVTDNYGSESIEVRQEPGEEISLTLSYGSAEHVIDSEGGTYTVSVVCNSDWTAAFAASVEGWTLNSDHSAGTVSVTAGVNTGDTLTGTVIVSAGSGTVEEAFEVTQNSHADNPYFHYIGSWDIYAADCLTGSEWSGTPGICGTCGIAEYSYEAGIFSMLDWGGYGMQCDALNFNAETRVVTLSLGCLCGSVTTETGDVDYLYFVSLNEEMTNLSTGSYPSLTLSDDGSTIDIAGIDDEYPILGLLGYNSHKGYYTLSDTYYCKAPLSLTRSVGTSSLGTSARSGFAFSPVAEDLPEGVARRLSFDSPVKISSLNVL